MIEVGPKFAAHYNIISRAAVLKRSTAAQRNIKACPECCVSCIYTVQLACIAVCKFLSKHTTKGTTIRLDIAAYSQSAANYALYIEWKLAGA